MVEMAPVTSGPSMPRDPVVSTGSNRRAQAALHVLLIDALVHSGPSMLLARCSVFARRLLVPASTTRRSVRRIPRKEASKSREHEAVLLPICRLL
jgi:hypothetical protein